MFNGELDKWVELRSQIKEEMKHKDMVSLASVDGVHVTADALGSIPGKALIDDTSFDGHPDTTEVYKIYKDTKFFALI